MLIKSAPSLPIDDSLAVDPSPVDPLLVTASMLVVCLPMETEDAVVGAMVVTGVDVTERLKRLFAGVVSEVVSWFSEVELTAIGSEKMLSYKSLRLRCSCVFQLQTLVYL